MSQDGRLVVSGSADHTLKLWEVEDGKWECVATLEHSDRVRCGVRFL